MSRFSHDFSWQGKVLVKPQTDMYDDGHMSTARQLAPEDPPTSLHGRAMDNLRYIRETMETHIRYYCAVREGRIVAASSAETDEEAQNVEMTDFATHPSCRGRGLCATLLATMEGDVQNEGMRTAYTIARAAQFAINITFARAGYRFGGTLRNNTNICGSFESMNVWYRALGERDHDRSFPDEGDKGAVERS